MNIVTNKPGEYREGEVATKNNKHVDDVESVKIAKETQERLMNVQKIPENGESLLLTAEYTNTDFIESYLGVSEQGVPYLGFHSKNNELEHAHAKIERIPLTPEQFLRFQEYGALPTTIIRKRFGDEEASVELLVCTGGINASYILSMKKDGQDLFAYSPQERLISGMLAENYSETRTLLEGPRSMPVREGLQQTIEDVKGGYKGQVIVGGPSGVGKTTWLHLLLKKLGKKGAVLEADHFYYGQKYNVANNVSSFDQHESINYARYCMMLYLLSEGRNVAIPQYDMVTSEPHDFLKHVEAPEQMIFAEGLLNLHPEIIEFYQMISKLPVELVERFLLAYDTTNKPLQAWRNYVEMYLKTQSTAGKKTSQMQTVFFYTDPAHAFLKRLERDHGPGGRKQCDPLTVVAYSLENVLPNYYRQILPSMKYAHKILLNDYRTDFTTEGLLS